MLVNTCSDFNYKSIRRDMMDKVAKITFKKDSNSSPAPFKEANRSSKPNRGSLIQEFDQQAMDSDEEENQNKKHNLPLKSVNIYLH